MPQHLRSQINTEIIIYPKQYLVSLLAKNKGNNPEHAFLIVEGIDEKNNQQALFRRYDLVADMDKSNPGIFRKGKSGIVIKEERYDLSDEAALRRFFWSMIIKDADNQHATHGASWMLTFEQATKLHTNVLDSRKNPPDYALSGKHSLVAASSSQWGENCYTWSREQLRKLNNDNIQNDGRLSVHLMDFLAAKTTRHIIPPTAETEKEPSSLRNPCALM